MIPKFDLAHIKNNIDAPKSHSCTRPVGMTNLSMNISKAVLINVIQGEKCEGYKKTQLEWDVGKKGFEEVLFNTFISFFRIYSIIE